MVRNRCFDPLWTLKAAIKNDSGTHYADFAIHLFSACEKSMVKGFADYAKDPTGKLTTMI